MQHTFFRTLEETLGRGMGWSLSPTSVDGSSLSAQRREARTTPTTRRTLEHVLDEDTAFGNLLVHDELLIIGSDEENHLQAAGS